MNCLINTWVLSVKTRLLIAFDTAFYAIIYNEIKTNCGEASADVHSKAVVLLLFIYCLLLLSYFGFLCVRSLFCSQRQYFVSFLVVGEESSVLSVF